MKRDASLDIMKGIGIVAVVFGHCPLFPYNTFIYSFHMPLFFLLAGYLFHSKPIKIALKKDSQRLILPYIVFSLISCLKFTVTKGIQGDYNAMAEVWWDAFCGKCGILWFLVALFVCKNVYNIISHTIQSNVTRYIVGGAISLLATIEAYNTDYLYWGILTGCSAMLFFLVGRYAETYRVKWYVICMCIICWLFALQYGRIDMDIVRYKCYPLDVLGACGAIWLIHVLSKKIATKDNFLSRIMIWLGRYSLVVLCMHHLTILLDPNARFHTQTWYVYLFIDFSIILPLTYLSTKVALTKRFFQV